MTCEIEFNSMIVFMYHFGTDSDSNSMWSVNLQIKNKSESYALIKKNNRMTDDEYDELCNSLKIIKKSDKITFKNMIYDLFVEKSHEWWY